jgi:hypothetical protein
MKRSWQQDVAERYSRHQQKVQGPSVGGGSYIRPELPNLLDQIDADVASLTADGAYDGQSVYDAVAERHPLPSVTRWRRLLSHHVSLPFRVKLWRRSATST